MHLRLGPTLDFSAIPGLSALQDELIYVDYSSNVVSKLENYHWFGNSTNCG